MTTNQHPPASIQTFTGKIVQPLAMRLEDISVQDIAHALSNKCRFSGMTREFYSVAQHSVYVSKVVETLSKEKYGIYSKKALLEIAQQGLFHDADEAYLPDIPTPIKKLPECLFLKEAGTAIFKVVMEKLNLPTTEYPIVKTADKILLATEKRDLMGPKEEFYFEEQPLVGFTISPLPPKAAFKLFLKRYHELFSSSV